MGARLACVAAFSGVAACSGTSTPTAPAGVGPTNDFSAYGRNPPPPDAPKAAWPEAGAGRPGGSAGCARPLAAGATTRTLDVDGAKRSFTLVVPPGHAGDAPLALVIALHGDGGNAESARRSFAELEKATNGRAVLAYPTGISGWDLDTPADRNADVHFFDALLFDAANVTCLDVRRVLVTGFSRGAYMANQLACRRGDRIRAVAPHAGGGPYENAGRYDDQGNLLCNARSIAAFVVHGAADREVPPSEGQNSVRHHRVANRCAARGHDGPMPGCITFDACAQPVAACTVQGLGHALSPEALRASWTFFEALR